MATARARRCFGSPPTEISICRPKFSGKEHVAALPFGQQVKVQDRRTGRSAGSRAAGFRQGRSDHAAWVRYASRSNTIRRSAIGASGRAIIDVADSCGVSIRSPRCFLVRNGPVVQVIRDTSDPKRSASPVGLVRHGNVEIRQRSCAGDTIVVKSRRVRLREGTSLRPESNDEWISARPYCRARQARKLITNFSFLGPRPWAIGKSEVAAPKPLLLCGAIVAEGTAPEERVVSIARFGCTAIRVKRQ